MKRPGTNFRTDRIALATYASGEMSIGDGKTVVRNLAVVRVERTRIVQTDPPAAPGLDPVVHVSAAKTELVVDEVHTATGDAPKANAGRIRVADTLALHDLGLALASIALDLDEEFEKQDARLARELGTDVPIPGYNS